MVEIPEGKVRKTFTPDVMTRNLVKVLSSAADTTEDEIIETSLDIFLRDVLTSSEQKTNSLIQYLTGEQTYLNGHNTIYEILIGLMDPKRLSKKKVKVDFLIDENVEKVRNTIVLFVPSAMKYEITPMAIKKLAIGVFHASLDQKDSYVEDIPEERKETVIGIIENLKKMMDAHTIGYNPTEVPA